VRSTHTCAPHTRTHARARTHAHTHHDGVAHSATDSCFVCVRTRARVRFVIPNAAWDSGFGILCARAQLVVLHVPIRDAPDVHGPWHGVRHL
jgi:hypothetical protein